MSKTKILLIYFIIISTTILVVNSGITSPFRGWLRLQIPNLDKVGHFIGMGLLTFFTLNTIKDIKASAFRIAFTLLAITILVTMEEYSQRYIESRSFQYWDLVADYSGIIVFTLVFYIIRTHFSNLTNQKSSNELIISNK